MEKVSFEIHLKNLSPWKTSKERKTTTRVDRKSSKRETEFKVMRKTQKDSGKTESVGNKSG